MATELEGFIKDIGSGFDEERKLTHPPNLWVALLSRNLRDAAFHELRFYDKAFITRSNNFRTGFYLEIATTDDLKLDVLKCTHFAVGGQCYAVSEGDTFPPSGDRFSWMIYGTFVKDQYVRP